MNTIKKLLWLLIGLGIVYISSVFAQTPAWNDPFGWTRTDINPNVPGATGLQGEKLLTTVQTFINWVLGILAFIALIVLLWWGFQMVTAAGDDNRYKKGFTILKQAAIWLVFIWLAWLIISLILSVIGYVTA